MQKSFRGGRVFLIEGYQPFAQYRNPFTMNPAQSYPLPPRSTVVGMIQNLVGDFSIGNHLDVAISGRAGGSFYNYVRMVKGALKYKDGLLWNTSDNNELPINQSQRTPIYQQELFDVRLRIFIRMTDDYFDVFNRMRKGVSKVATLGRGSDVFYIRRLEEVTDMITTKVRKHRLITGHYHAYAPQKSIPWILPDNAMRFSMLETDYKLDDYYFYSIFAISRLDDGNIRKVHPVEVYYLEGDSPYLINPSPGDYPMLDYFEEKGCEEPLFWWSSWK